MGPIRNPNWSTSGMRVMLSYLMFNGHAQYSAHTRHSSTVCTVQRASCVFAQILASSAQLADTRFGGVVPMSKGNFGRYRCAAQLKLRKHPNAYIAIKWNLNLLVITFLTTLTPLSRVVSRNDASSLDGNNKRLVCVRGDQCLPRRRPSPCGR